MFTNFFRTTFRNLWRNKLHTLINITSLSLGLVIFALALLYVKKELTYDHSWPEAERIIRFLGETRDLPGFANGIGPNVPSSRFFDVRGFFAEELDNSTRIYTTSVVPADEESTRNMPLTLVDAEFNDIFQLEAVQGSMAQALAGPGFIALEEEFAKTLGAGGALGARVRYKNNTDVALEYEVAAIFRMPANVSPRVIFRQLTLLSDGAWPLVTPFVTTEVWATLKSNVDLATFNAMQAGYVRQRVDTYDSALSPNQNIADHLIFSWQRLVDIHFNPTIPQDQINPGASGNAIRVATVAVVGLLVLLVGCSNSISLSLAAVLERRREVGIRKAVGAQQGDLAVQYLGESVAMALLALLPALLVLSQLPRLINAFTATPVPPLSMQFADYLLLLLICIVVGFINGLYPMSVLASIKPQAVLKPHASSGTSSRQQVRTVLVATQFCLALILLIGTAALYMQLAVTRSQPLGFNVDNTVFINFNSQQQFDRGDALAQELGRLPGVLTVLRTSYPPNRNLPAGVNEQNVTRKGEEATEAEFQVFPIAYDFFEFVNIPLLAGRGFDARFEVAEGRSYRYSEAEAGPAAQRVVINRTGARALGYTPEEAVDQLVYTTGAVRQQDGTVTRQEMARRIIGVIEDNMYHSLSRMPGAEIYVFTPPSAVPGIALKFDSGARASLVQRIQDAATTVMGGPMQNIFFGEDRLATAFQQEKMESRLLLACGLLAMLLSCIGLYGLTAFTMKHRTKEVGVRKVLGSSVGTLVRLFLWRFAKPILVASLVASPVAIYFALRWIQRFPYQLDKVWLVPICLATVSLVLLVALLTVSMLTTRAAMIRPVKSLRYE